MYSLKDMPSPSSIFSAYASFTASMMLVRSMANDLIPLPIRDYVFSTFGCFFKPRSSKLTLVIEEHNGMGRNQVYDASETYLCTKISPKADRLKISKSPKEKGLTIQLEKGEVIVDSYEGINFKWRFLCEKESPNDQPKSDKRVFELSFDKKHKEEVLYSYLPFVLNKAKAIKDEEKVVKLCTLRHCQLGFWDSINLEHPATFETLAMDPDLKKTIIDDMDMFVRRKEFYKRVGKAWKRGYLLYGPPGTGKSSLIAAMANYLKFDVYDLQLANITRDSDLRTLLLMTANKSILVIEDIDCSIGFPDITGKKTIDLLDRRHGNGSKQPNVQLTLSGLLNFIDGLWSSCGDERIIVFTTNHKDRLDPALLRPGRMDVHIHMSYCTPQGFKLLASNYLGISWHHKFFGEIESLLENVAITPAQVAEELMKSEDREVALTGLVKVLKRKVTESDQIENEAKNKGVMQAKRQKIRKADKIAVDSIRRSNRKRNL